MEYYKYFLVAIMFEAMVRKRPIVLIIQVISAGAGAQT